MQISSKWHTRQEQNRDGRASKKTRQLQLKVASQKNNQNRQRKHLNMANQKINQVKTASQFSGLCY